MALPDGDMIPLEVIADRWTKIFGELVTINRLRSWHTAGLLRVKSTYRSGRREGKSYINWHYWITREERDRFEGDYVPDTSRQSDLEYMMGQFLNTEPSGGAAGLFRFMKEKGAKFVREKMIWTDPTGKDHEVNVKTATNKLSELKRKRREQYR